MVGFQVSWDRGCLAISADSTVVGSTSLSWFHEGDLRGPVYSNSCRLGYGWPSHGIYLTTFGIPHISSDTWSFDLYRVYKFPLFDETVAGPLNSNISVASSTGAICGDKRAAIAAIWAVWDSLNGCVSEIWYATVFGYGVVGEGILFDAVVLVEFGAIAWFYEYGWVWEHNVYSVFVWDILISDALLDVFFQGRRGI